MIINIENSSSAAVATSKKTHSLMSRRVLLRNSSPSTSSSSSSSPNGRHPLLRNSNLTSSSSSCCSGRFGEVAGGTTAECAAICCCCPCGLVNLLILTMYKVPARLCRRALRKKRRQQLIKKGLLPPRSRRCECGCDDTEIQMHPAGASFNRGSVEILKSYEEEDEEAMAKLEKQMWETFYGTGFWRSPSQREPPPSPPPPPPPRRSAALRETKVQQ